jgi:hypothetical protein
MAKAKDPKSVIQDITNRYRVTAREARDIVTAVGDVGFKVLPGSAKDPAAKGPVLKNLAKQVKETGRAAVTGKKGTTSDIIGKAVPGKRGVVNVGYTKGTQRTSRKAGASKSMKPTKGSKGN